jgi:hypothetical protein
MPRSRSVVDLVRSACARCLSRGIECFAQVAVKSRACANCASAKLACSLTDAGDDEVTVVSEATGSRSCGRQGADAQSRLAAATESLVLHTKRSADALERLSADMASLLKEVRGGQSLVEVGGSQSRARLGVPEVVVRRAPRALKRARQSSPEVGDAEGEVEGEEEEEEEEEVEIATLDQVMDQTS